MASKRTGLISRWLARRAGRVAAEDAAVEGAPAREAGDGTDARPATPASAAQADSPGSASNSGSAAAAFPAAGVPGPDAAASQVPEPQAPDPGVSADQVPEAAAGGSEAETEESPQGATGSAQGATPETGARQDQAPAPREDALPAAHGHKVVTLVSVVEHAGASTLAAALERRSEGTGWRIQTAGPGLLRAAFAGRLEDVDALVLVSPADPACTATLGEKLLWLEANDRTGMPARTLVVVNLGAAAGGELQLPADLDRPVILLPFDAALSLTGSSARAPRRATRRAVDQLVDELSTILQEH